MEKEKLVFDENCNFNETTKKLINTINDKQFLAIFDFVDNYNVSANMLIAIQNTVKEKYESIKNNTEFSINDKDIYEVFEEHFNGLFEIVDNSIDDTGMEMLNYLIDLLFHHIVYAIANGLEKGQISPDDLGD